MISRLCVPACVALLLATSACIVGTNPMTAPPSQEAPEEIAEAEPLPPPIVDPPPLSLEVWQMPDLEIREPRFPYLPGEPRQTSRSIGDVISGHMVESAAVPIPHPHLAVLPVQLTRDLIYTTEGMLELLTSAAAHVAEAHPGSVAYLGNISARGGGDIPWSISHNAGRDADVAFYVLGADGEPTILPNLRPSTTRVSSSARMGPPTRERSFISMWSETGSSSKASSKLR
ncbi:MAG: hypothetical protein ACNA8W_14335, partial [Bradymonadaceae bacterium]